MMETTIHEVTDYADARMLHSELRMSQLASLDVETTPVPWYHPDFKLLTIAISIKEGEAHVIGIEHPEAGPDGLELAQIVLSDVPPHVKWVMQNGAFDLLALQARDIYLNTPWFDTMGVQYLLDVEAPKSLEALVMRWLGFPPWKDIDYKAPQDEDIQTLFLLNGRDADATLRLWLPMQEALRNQPEQQFIYDYLLQPAMETLAQMELHGFPVDMERLLDLAAEVEVRIEDTLADIRDLVGLPELNPNSTKQLQKLLYGQLGLPVTVFTDGGAPSTNKEALRNIEDLHAIIPMIQQFRTDRKLLTASLLPWTEHVDENNTMHPRYKPAHVKTGRLASEMPNIQQVPRDEEVRGVFGGKPGYKIVDIDYSQLELRIVAWLAGEETMLRAFELGQDLHELTAATLGVDRYTGKTANFGLLYGAGPRKLKWIAAEAGIEMTELEAERIRAQWFALYPAIADFHEAAIHEARTTGGITTAIGRWRPLPDINSNDWPKKGGAERQAVNTPVQSLASDITLMVLNELYKDPALKRAGIKPIATVHDSILFLVPDDQLKMIPYIQEQMEEPPLEMLFGVKLGVPLETEAKVGDYWGQT
jgi:DNA polymerase-1